MSTTPTSTLAGASASELQILVAARDVSCREVVDAHLRRIEAVNGDVNALRLVLADEARTAADEADRRLAGGAAARSLEGVPFSAKENVDVAGTPDTRGLLARRDAVATADAPAVAGLKAAGAICLGRGNMAELALRWHTENGLAGATRNPWDATRSPGGSSGGDAVAVATGMVALGVGTDLGGSIRYPASACGIAGLRPSFGRVAQAQSVEPVELLLCEQLMSVTGPLARRVGDLRTALAAMAVPDVRDAWQAPVPLGGETPHRLGIAVASERSLGGLDPSVAAGLRQAAGALADAGHAVEELDLPALDGVLDAWLTITGADIAAHWGLIEAVTSEPTRRMLAAALGSREAPDLDAYRHALLARGAIARAYAAIQSRTPLILGPVSTRLPFVPGSDVDDPFSHVHSLRLSLVANLLGLPAVTVPVGIEAGLPQGVQLLAPRSAEHLCLAAAEAIEARVGTFTPTDPR